MEARRNQVLPIVTPPIAPPVGLVVPYITLVKVGGNANGPPFLVGDQVEYYVLVFNPATITATQVAIEDWIPEHTTYLPGSATTTRGAIAGPDPLHVDIDEQPGLKMTLFKFRVTVDPCPSSRRSPTVRRQPLRRMIW